MRHLFLTTLLLFITAMWGWTFTVVKDAVAGYGVVSFFLAVRFAIALLCLGPFAWRGVTRKAPFAGGCTGVFLASGYLFQTFGLCWTTLTNGGLITSLFVLFAPLSERLLFGVRTLCRLWAAIGLSLLGLLLLTGTGPTPLTLGDLLMLGAAASFGVQIALLGRFAKQHDMGALTLVQLASAGAVFFFTWPLTEPFAWPSPAVWRALLLTGVVATAAGYSIQTLAQRHLPAARAAIIFTLEAPFAALFGYLLAGDRLIAPQILGAIFMIAAVVLASVGRWPGESP